MTEIDVSYRCRGRVDPGALGAPTRTLCVDGTCCVGKTTVLNLIAKNLPGNERVYKVQQTYAYRNINSHGVSMFGYICSGILDTRGPDAPRFSDRTPLNPEEWKMLWKFFCWYVELFGFSRRPPATEEEEAADCDDRMRSFLKKFDDMFATLRLWHGHKEFRDQINAIALIDSDVEAVEARMRKRAMGSDIERAGWAFYVPLQNRMYRILYPGACIDLAEFGDIDRDAVQHGLAAFLIETSNGICDRYDKLPRSRVPKVVGRLSRFPEPRDETENDDLTLGNAKTHVRRVVGRACAKRIVDGPGDESAAAFSEYLNRHIPAFLRVSGIKDPLDAGTELSFGADGGSSDRKRPSSSTPSPERES